MEGIIFDIQKFALHDGPGIRTAVFLKGCPLKCVWCCNPESQSILPQLGTLKDRCINCHKCIPTCKTGALSLENNNLKVNHKQCNACGSCLKECDKNALKIYGYFMSSDRIIAEVLKDKDYFDNSGGGITITGGEPMEQPEFLIELLKKAKKADLNTCIETSGYAKKKNFQYLLPLVDLFYVDYKLTDNLKHRHFTGKGNEEILANIKFLHDNNAQIIIRCPIMPGINDTLEHFKGIAALSTNFPKIKGVEIMPFHNFGTHKYDQTGKTANLGSLVSVDPQTVHTWMRNIIELGGHKTFVSK